jgi:hypothetical protein
MAGPIWLIAPRAAADARSSAAKSAEVTGSPVTSTCPDSDWPTGTSRPRTASAPDSSRASRVAARQARAGLIESLYRA